MLFWDKYVSSLDTSRLFHNDDMFQKDAIRSDHLIPSSLAEDIDSFCQSNSISEYAFFWQFCLFTLLKFIILKIWFLVRLF